MQRRSSVKSVKRLVQIGALALLAAWLLRVKINSSFDAHLLPVGSAAPRFSLTRAGGGRLALDAVLRDRKAVLVNFWFYS